MPSSRSPRRLRWGIVAVVLVLLAGGVVAALLLRRRPGSVSNPHVAFSQPASTPASTTPRPKPRPAAPPFAWPRYGYDAGRTRFFASAVLKPPFRVGWRLQDYALLEFPPVIYDDTLFLLDDDGSAKAIDKLDGHVLWQRKVGTLAAASPALAVGQGLIVITLLSTNAGAGQAPGNGRVEALSMHDGRVIWSHAVPAGSETSPLAYGNEVYFGDQAGDVEGLNVADGRVLWTFHASGAVKGGPSLSDGRLYFGDYSGHVYALDAASGREIWSSGAGVGNFYSTAAVAFGRVYLGNTDGRVYSFSASTGALAWATQTGAYVYASPAVAEVPHLGATVYIGSYDGSFYAFDARSGAVRWSHPSGGRISGSATIVGGVVYYSVLGSRRTIGLDLRDGRQVFSYPDGAFNPVVCDPHAIYMDGYSTIYQLLPTGHSR
jgi:outer membrane protein assembly factor BamB